MNNYLDDYMYYNGGINPFHMYEIYGRGGLGYKPHYIMGRGKPTYVTIKGVKEGDQVIEFLNKKVDKEDYDWDGLGKVIDDVYNQLDLVKKDEDTAVTNYNKSITNDLKNLRKNPDSKDLNEKFEKTQSELKDYKKKLDQSKDYLDDLEKLKKRVAEKKKTLVKTQNKRLEQYKTSSKKKEIESEEEEEPPKKPLKKSSKKPEEDKIIVYTPKPKKKSEPELEELEKEFLSHTTITETVEKIEDKSIENNEFRNKLDDKDNILYFPSQTQEMVEYIEENPKNPIYYAFKSESSTDKGIGSENLIRQFFSDLFDKISLSGKIINDTSELENSKTPLDKNSIFTQAYKDLSHKMKENFIIDFGKSKSLIEMKLVDKELHGINDDITLTITKLTENFSFKIIFNDYNGRIKIDNIIYKDTNKKMLKNNTEGYDYFIYYAYQNTNILVDILNKGDFKVENGILKYTSKGTQEFERGKREIFNLSDYQGKLMELDCKNLIKTYLMSLQNYKEFYNDKKVSSDSIYKLFGRDSKIAEFIINPSSTIDKFVKTPDEKFQEKKSKKELKIAKNMEENIKKLNIEGDIVEQNKKLLIEKFGSSYRNINAELETARSYLSSVRNNKNLLKKAELSLKQSEAKKRALDDQYNKVYNIVLSECKNDKRLLDFDIEKESKPSLNPFAKR